MHEAFRSVFRCAQCDSALDEIPTSGYLDCRCPGCGTRYELLRGRVVECHSDRDIVRMPTPSDSGLYTRRYQLHLELPTDRVEVVTFGLNEVTEELITSRGDLVCVMRQHGNPLSNTSLGVYNATRGESHVTSAQRRRLPKGLLIGAGVAAFLWLASSSIVDLEWNGVTYGPYSLALLITAVVAGAGAWWYLAGSSRRNGRIGAERTTASQPSALTATQRLRGEALRLEERRLETVRTLAEQRQLSEQLVALRRKMEGIGLAAYQPRIAMIERGIATLSEQISLDMRLRDGYARSIAMIDIELAAGQAVERLSADVMPRILDRLEEFRALEEQQKELTYELAANVEVEGLLRKPTTGSAGQLHR